MDKDVIETKRQLPVLIGNNHEHVMAVAEISRKPNAVSIQIIASGSDGQLLAEFLEQAAPIAMSFIAIPVQNIIEKRENI